MTLYLLTVSRSLGKGKMNIVLPDRIWKSVLSRIHSCSINSRRRLIQFKVIHRFRYYKVMLHKCSPSVSPVCDKCKSNDGTFILGLSAC